MLLNPLNNSEFFMFKSSSKLFVTPVSYLFITLLSSLLSACSPSHSSTPSSQETLEQTDKNPPPLILATAPYEIPSRIEQRFIPLTQYLTAVLHRPVHFIITPSYSDLIKKIGLGKVDLAYMGPVPYIKAKQNFKQAKGSIQLLAVEKPYRAAIIVHQDSTIKNIQDITGHSMAFSDYFSYTGHFAGRKMMADQDIHLSDLQIYSFLGRHERAILAVVHKDFDATTTSLGLAKRFIQLGYPIRIIAVSDDLPPVGMVAKAALPLDLKNAISNALLTPPFDQVDQLYKFGNFFPPQPQKYQSVSKVIQYFEAH